jgi:hypothetical protein
MSTFFCNFDLERVIREVQTNQDGMEINGVCQLLAYADDVNFLDENTNIIQKN